MFFAGKAIVTAVIGRLEPPKTLEILMRTCEASAVIYKVWRMVELLKTAPVWFCHTSQRNMARVKVLRYLQKVLEAG